MFDNEMSVEALYAHATGLENSKPDTFLVSTEAFDGYYDNLSVEMQSAENALNFTDTYSMIEQKNASDKIRMLNKIKANYGGNNTGAASIESFCNVKSMEAEAAAADAGTDVNPKNTGDTAKKESKIKKFFTTVFGAIGTFFKTIWETICKIPGKILKFFQNLKAKRAAKKAEAAANTAAKLDAKQQADLIAKNAETAGPYVIDFTKDANDANLRKFATAYKQYAIDVVSFGEFVSKLTSGGGRDNMGSDSTFKEKLSGVVKIANSFPEMTGIPKNAMNMSSNSFAAGNYSFKQVKSLLDNVKQGLVIREDKNKAAEMSCIKYLVGLDCITIKELVSDVRKFNILEKSLDRGIKMANGFNNIIKEMDDPHKKLVSLCDKYTKKIDLPTEIKSDSDQAWGTIHDWQIQYATIASALKLATGVEQFVAKLFTKVSKSVVDTFKLGGQANNLITAQHATDPDYDKKNTFVRDDNYRLQKHNKK